MLQQKVSRRTWKAFGSSREGLKGRRGVVVPARKRTSSRVRAGKGDIEEDFLCSSTTSSCTSTDRSLGRVSICTSSCFSEDSSERRREGNRNRVAAVLGAVELARWGVGLDTAKAVALESSGSIAGGGLHIAHLMDQFVILVESSAAHSGPFGLLILGSVIATSELVPLVPTQPLALVSGLLFGASKVSILINGSLSLFEDLFLHFTNKMSSVFPFFFLNETNERTNERTGSFGNSRGHYHCSLSGVHHL